MTEEEAKRLVAEAREEVRAKCEAIAAAEHERTRLPCRLVAGRIADAIAALKGNGEVDV